MDYKPFKDVPSAYTLHYHFGYQTKFNRPTFDSEVCEAVLSTSLKGVCEYKKYHLLEHQVQPDKLLCLLSLRPDQVIADVSRVAKANLSREFNIRFGEIAATLKDRVLWAPGYHVRSVGKASRQATQGYIESQGEHHGMRNKRVVELMRWVNPNPYRLRAAHADFDLSHHVVLVTSGRRDVFDDFIAPGLFERWADYAEAEGFYIERASLVPDHTHLLVKIAPTQSIKTCVLGLMNDSWA